MHAGLIVMLIRSGAADRTLGVVTVVLNAVMFGYWFSVLVS
jgi:hypothetical protein